MPCNATLPRQLSILTFLLLSCAAPHAQSEVESFPANLIDAAVERTNHSVAYSGSYYSIEYPGGDVPANVGVCTDLIIRSYRKVGIDLQKLVHVDMTESFDKYPDNWGLSRPDSNIDHRRVPNLQRFFARHGTRLAVTDSALDYKPGDLVTWMLPGNLPHIGIVVSGLSADGLRHLIVHNIGQGPKLEDVLFDYDITGHYRYSGPEPALNRSLN